MNLGVKILFCEGKSALRRCEGEILSLLFGYGVLKNPLGNL